MQWNYNFLFFFWGSWPLCKVSGESKHSLTSVLKLQRRLKQRFPSAPFISRCWETIEILKRSHLSGFVPMGCQPQGRFKQVRRNVYLGLCPPITSVFGNKRCWHASEKTSWIRHARHATKQLSGSDLCQPETGTGTDTLLGRVLTWQVHR